MAKIAVEDSLNSVKAALQNSGHEVVTMSGGNVDGCACCVISGQDKNVMGIADRATSASVINAEGMSTDEIVRRVDQSLAKV
ncbi:YkuS family protein [Paenibacillus sp. TRM 82003]|nr:YkuS family protein [Paenibacillus sp. TRM 82003]